jgi:hypothetical protein
MTKHQQDLYEPEARSPLRLRMVQMQDNHSRHLGSNRAAVLIAVFLAGLIIAPEPTWPAQKGDTIRACKPQYPSRQGYVQVTVKGSCKEAVAAAVAKWRAEVAGLYGGGWAYWWERAERDVCTCKYVMGQSHALASVRGKPCILRTRLGTVIPPVSFNAQPDPLAQYEWGQCP